MLINRLDGRIIYPSPTKRSICGSCEGELIAKCGTLKQWHWAHMSNDCDPWAEHETEWHVAWKKRFPVEDQEVVIKDEDGVAHRADVCTAWGWVVEFQHSSISSAEIRERELFYGQGMFWVLDGTSFLDNFIVRVHDSYCSFHWKWPHTSWFVSNRPVFIDLGGDCLFHVRKVYTRGQCHGWGDVLTERYFCRAVTNGKMSLWRSIVVVEGRDWK